MDEKKSAEYVPGISFSLKWGKIHIYRSSLYCMKNPKYIRLLFDPKRKLFALQACGREKGSIRVPKNIGEDWEFRLNSIGLINMIWSVCGWNEEYTYQIQGKYYRENNLAEFNLIDAKSIDFS